MPDPVVFTDAEIASLQREYKYEDGFVRRTKTGRLVGATTGNGYRIMSVYLPGRKRSNVCVHRVVWMLLNGAIPDDLDVDHVDFDRSNNKIDNLRLLNRSQNTYRKRHKQRALPRGVARHISANKSNPFVAQLCGKTLGYFSTPELAKIAYDAAREKLFQHHPPEK
jgi:hypothetical protein